MIEAMVEVAAPVAIDGEALFAQIFLVIGRVIRELETFRRPQTRASTGIHFEGSTGFFAEEFGQPFPLVLYKAGPARDPVHGLEIRECKEAFMFCHGITLTGVRSSRMGIGNQVPAVQVLALCASFTARG
jgi:hypothetical protein